MADVLEPLAATTARRTRVVTDAEASKSGVGEREHARVYPNARSGGGGRKEDKRVVGGGRWRAPSVRRERGATCSGKAFVSQCAPEIPIGATSRQKVLRYQQMARSVLNRGCCAWHRLEGHYCACALGAEVRCGSKPVVLWSSTRFPLRPPNPTSARQ